MEQEYFIVENGRQKGPFTLGQLKEQKITKQTLIWTVGLDDWIKAMHLAVMKDLVSNDAVAGDSNQEFVIPPIPHSKGNEIYFGYQLAGRGHRFLAAVIEIIITTIPWVIFFGWGSDDDAYFTLANFGGQALYGLVWGAILYPFFSGNLGHKIMGLKVISEVDGKDQNTAVAGALREALKSVFSMFFIPAIWLLWDDKKQNLYDKVVKTLVVKISN